MAGLARRGGRSNGQGWQVQVPEVAGLVAKGGRCVEEWVSLSWSGRYAGGLQRFGDKVGFW